MGNGASDYDLALYHYWKATHGRGSEDISDPFAMASASNSSLPYNDSFEAFDNFSRSNWSMRGERDPCFMHPSPFLHVQYYVVCVGGTLVAATSVLENLLVLYLLFTRKYFWRRHYFYLMVIALLDAVFSWAYIMVLSTIVFFEHNENLTIMRIWYAYIVPGQTIVQVAQTSSTYLLVAASAEKFLAAKSLADKITDAKRFAVIAASILLSIIIKGPLYFEIRVDYRPYCAGLKEYILMPSELLYDDGFVGTTYNKVFVFWIRHIMTVFLPFISLVCLNAGIILRDGGIGASVRLLCCGTDQQGASAQGKGSVTSAVQDSTLSGWVSRARLRVRMAATRTLLAMIITYLVSNTFGVIITAWEHFDYESLSHHYQFYTYASDVISILAVLTCALRLPTYLACDLKFRHEFHKLFCCLGRRRSGRSGQSSMESRAQSAMSGVSGLPHANGSAVGSRSNGFASFINASVGKGSGGTPVSLAKSRASALPAGGGAKGTFGSFILREMRAKEMLKTAAQARAPADPEDARLEEEKASLMEQDEQDDHEYFI